MHTVLIWVHVGLMMIAFGASPLGRLGLRYLLSKASGAQAAQSIVRGFSGIFLAGGIAVTISFCVGLALAWNAGLTQAEGEAYATILNEKTPFLAAVVSPLLWLYVLWLMIERPV